MIRRPLFGHDPPQLVTLPLQRPGRITAHIPEVQVISNPEHCPTRHDTRHQVDHERSLNLAAATTGHATF